MQADPDPSPAESRNLTPAPVVPPTQTSAPANRKRKRAPPRSAPSPAPSDTGTNGGTNPPEVIFIRADLSSRPQLSVSRGPIFTPVSEGSEYHKTDMVGVNRVGYRYIPAGINPVGSALPCHTIETLPKSYRISWEDRSPFIKVTKDGLGLAGGKGFRSARCNAPIREGKWYMEIKILQGGGERLGDENRREGCHVRLGWGRREAPLNGPVGLDGYSYGYRDKTGDKVTLSRPRPYGREYGSGDVIGMYISLPPRRQPNKNDHSDPAHIKRERIPIDLKGQEMFESLEYPQIKEMTNLMDYSGGKPPPDVLLDKEKEKKKAAKKSLDRPLPILPGSRIAFFVNGESQGIAFNDIYSYLQIRGAHPSTPIPTNRKRGREGVKEHRQNEFDDGWLGYYPFISLFNDAEVRLNSGPDFDYPPPPDIDALLDGDEEKLAQVKQERTWRPISERYSEFMREQWDYDAVEEEEARAELLANPILEPIETEKKTQKSRKRTTGTPAEPRNKKSRKTGPSNLATSSTPAPDEQLLDHGERTSVDRVSVTPGPNDERYGSIGLTYPNHQQYPGSFTGPIDLNSSSITNFEFVIEGSIEHEHSPAPTHTSNGDFLGGGGGGQSGYNSDLAEMDDRDQVYGFSVIEP
ncbi:hypothetical protein BDN72DRAFT_887324 [Pluteus cervinus]|uniref:Uncharacterized protein n=1 Tax=Pluteus cervinus TaxID=181527 RepID=A0ACD3B2V5_9AGAR|nr:hypothetical protein BDN72DRAFT_887324 [Pluteus cervinus]